MEATSFRIGQATVDYHFGGALAQLKELADKKTTVLLVDENVFEAHGKKLKGWNLIVLKAGEAFKVQATVDAVIGQLIDLGADRGWTLVGIGGGVVTDLTGYIASVFLRGVRFGFVPTTLLALVDASIGGKNGIDVGPYKNMIGTIRQPAFILHDLSLLKTLPETEWRSGFAEIIKHAAIRDAQLFRELEAADMKFYQKNATALEELVRRNALLKTRVVMADETEQGDRRLLNFGHTLGHALEKIYELTHGEAISIGMGFAARLSETRLGFKEAERVIALLQHYGLPTEATYNKDKVLPVLTKDKKKAGNAIRFVLLQKIGKAVTEPITIKDLAKQI